MDFHHVAISVRDLSKSKDFYQDLGFKEVHRWEAEDNKLTIAQLKLGNVILELSEFKENMIKDQIIIDDISKRELGLMHFGLRVSNVRDVYKKMLKEGFVMRDPGVKKGRTGIDYFFIIDPDGMWVEIVQDDRNY
jgi:glyoxylase I family protein